MEKRKLKQPLFLCGMMGSGKSTVGKTLAEMLDAEFQDLDEMIANEADMSIPDIFEKHGESYFRELEQQLLIKVSQKTTGIMALGGGSLQNQRIVDHLKIYGWLVFLNVPKYVILERISEDQNRPMISDNNQLQNTVESLISQRMQFYEQAQITINAAEGTPTQIAEKILKRIDLYEGFNRG